jgi:hypothetical protein
MTRLLRCVGADRNAYYVNVDQIAWCFRPHGATHTVIRFAGTPDAISVRETPHQIMTHALGSDDQRQADGHSAQNTLPRRREQPMARDTDIRPMERVSP